VRPCMSVKNTNGIARTQETLNASFTMRCVSWPNAILQLRRQASAGTECHPV
jgi:hypothetical protein